MLDTDQIEWVIHQKAIAGLQRAAEFTLERAKYHAPVRSLFDRRRSPRGPAIPRSWKTINSRERYTAFLRSKSRMRSINPEVSKYDEFLSGNRQAKGSPYLQGIAPEAMSSARLSGRRVARRQTFSGHANSLVPVTRYKDYTVAGDLRRWSPLGGGSLMPMPIVRQRRGMTKQGKRRPVEVGPAEQGGFLQKNLLTARGRYEVRHASEERSGSITLRGKKRYFATSALFHGRVGGRLRGEIHMSGPVWRGDEVWMYIESPTPYARHQEFGSTHNRPQPFLRPALYESRNVLRFEVGKAVDPRINVLPEG